MQEKFNWRLLLAAVMIIGALAVGVGALWWFAVHRNPARYVAQGDAAVKAGQYKEAIPFYGRAIRYTSKQTDRVPVLLKMADAFRKTPVENAMEAYFCFQNVLSIHNQVVEIDPANRQALDALVHDLFDIAQDTGNTQDWDRLQSKADLLLKTYPDDPLALKCRGLARFTLATRGKLDEKDVTAIQKDLTAAAQQFKDDPDPAYTLAQLLLLQGREKLNLGERTVAMAKFKEAQGLVDAYAAAHPAVPLARLNAIRLTRDLATLADDDALAAQCLRDADALEAILLKQDDPATTRQLAAFFWGADREVVALPNGKRSTRGVERGVKLLQTVLAKHPDDINVQIDLGRQYRLRERFTEAADLFRRASADRKVTPSPDIMRLRNQQLMARYELISVLLEQRDRATTPAEREKLLTAAEDLFQVLKKDAGPAPAVELLDGKLEFINGQYWHAVELLASADAKFERRNNEVALWLGKALTRLGQTSAGIGALERAVVAGDLPGEWRVEAAQELAQALMAMHFFNDAATLTRSLVKALPDKPEPKMILAAILLEQVRATAPEARAGLAADAAKLVRPLADSGNLEAGRLYANVLFLQGQTVEARDRLLALAAKDPAQVSVLRDLIALDRLGGPSSPKIRQQLLSSLKTVPDSDPKRLALAAVEAKDQPFPAPLPDLVTLAFAKDGFQQAIGMYQYYQIMQKPADAAKALEQAAKLKPTSSIVASIRFDEAMRAQDYTAARAILDNAVKTDLNPTEIKFMQGQLAVAQNRPQEAITALNLALAERPQSSEGWTLLGTAHRMSGDLRNAESSFIRALELKRDNLAALQGAFATYDAMQQREKALEALRQAAYFTAGRNQDLFNLYLNYLGQFGDKRQALAIRRNLTAQMPQNADNLRATAQLLLDLNEVDQARTILADLLRKNPADRSSVWAMAIFDLTTGQANAGLALIQDYLKRRGDKADVDDCLLLARFNRQIGQAGPARDAYRQALAKVTPPAIPVLMEAGEQAMSAKAFADAAALYRQVLARQKNGDAWGALIEALIRQNQIDEANKEMQSWKASEPWSSRMAFAEVRLLNERGRIADAELAATEAIRKDSNNASLYLLRAQVRYNDASENVQAVVKGDLGKALELNPSLLLAREMYVDWFFKRNRLDEAAEQLRRLIAARPDNPVYRVQLARIYLQLERTDDLDTLLKDAILQLPGMPVWHQLRASLRLMQNRSADAVGELGKAYELNPIPETVQGYGEALIASNNANRALEVFAKWPNIVGKSPILLALQGRAMIAANQAFSAEKVFARAFSLAGDNFDELDNVVNQYSRVAGPKEVRAILEERIKSDKSGATAAVLAKYYINRGDSAQAIPLLDDLRGKLTPDSATLPNVLWLLGVAYYDNGQYLKARGAYEALLKLQPSNSSAINNLAYLLAEELKLPQEALPLAEKAATFWQPNADGRANVLDTLGRVQFLANNPIEAEDSLKRSVAAKSLPINNLHLGEVLAARGRAQEAADYLATAQQQVRLPRDKELKTRIDTLLRELRAGRAAAGATTTGWSLDRPPAARPDDRQAQPPPVPATKPTPTDPPAAPRGSFDGPPPPPPAA